MLHDKLEEQKQRVLGCYGIQKSEATNIEKSKTSFPIGTIHNGYKKIAEGKWQKVSKHRMTKQEHEDFAKNEYNRASILRRAGSGAADTAVFNGDYHKKHSKELDDKEYDDEDVFSLEELAAQKKNQQGLNDLADYSKQEQVLVKNVSKSEYKEIKKSKELTPGEKQEEIRKNILSSYGIDTIEKGGKRATIGEVRIWGGRKMVKHQDGWVEIKVNGNHKLHTPDGKVQSASEEHVNHAKNHLDRHEREGSYKLPSELKELEKLGVQFIIGNSKTSPVERVNVPIDLKDREYDAINNTLYRHNLIHLKHSIKLQPQKLS